MWSARLIGRNGPTRGKLGPWKPVSLYRRPYGARYVVVCMRAVPGGKVSCHYVHRLVLEAFVGPCPEGMEVRRFPDRDTSNNRAENLSWGTRSQNMQDKKAHGTFWRTHCKAGHEMAGDNLQIRPSGKRTCRTCQKARLTKRRGLRAVGLLGKE